jgi:hypothetical protein
LFGERSAESGLTCCSEICISVKVTEYVSLYSASEQ